MRAISEIEPKHALRPGVSDQVPMPAFGLGPNQLTWLRRNVAAFRQAEELWMSVRRDTMRSARAAGIAQ